MLAIHNWKPGDQVPRLTIYTRGKSISPIVRKTRSMVTNEISFENAKVASALEHQCAALVSPTNIRRLNHSTTSTNGGTTLLDEQSQTTKERKMLEAKLDEERKARFELEAERRTLQQKLQDMEAQLMIGGEIADNAAKQEAQLQKAEQDQVRQEENEKTQPTKKRKRGDMDDDLGDDDAQVSTDDCNNIMSTATIRNVRLPPGHLGITIEETVQGRKFIYIADLTESSPISGSVNVGDEIVSYMGTSLEGLDIDKIIHIIGGSSFDKKDRIMQVRSHIPNSQGE